MSVEQLACYFVGFVAALIIVSAAGDLGFNYVELHLRKMLEDQRNSKGRMTMTNEGKSTFYLRYGRLLAICNPKNLFYSTNAVFGFKKELELFFDDSDTFEDDEILKRLAFKQIVVDSAMNPEGDIVVPRAFRMAGYLPFNGPVCVGLSLAKTLPTFLFWSWLNQSQAALVNLFNLSGNSTSSTFSILVCYTIGVSAALLSSAGITNAIKMYVPLTLDQEKTLFSYLPVPTNGFAGVLNCLAMSWQPLKNGLKIINEHKTYYSKIAAKRAVVKTMVSRALLPVPCFLIPSLVMRFEYVQMFSSLDPHINAVLEVFVPSLCFGIGLPAVMAIFPEICSIKRDVLEDDIKLGASNRILYYNRGL